VIAILSRWKSIRPILGLLVATGLTFAVTGALKNLTGQLRPDFLARCNPVEMQCTGEKNLVMEGRRSFPSGHSSSTLFFNENQYEWILNVMQMTVPLIYICTIYLHTSSHLHPSIVVSASGTIYLSMYLMARLGHPGFVTAVMPYEDQEFEFPKAMAFRLLAMVIPPTIGAAIAVTRILDNRHHWRDIILGYALGMFMSLFASRAYLRRWHRPRSSESNDPIVAQEEGMQNS
jgi:membrane-associated phospholipid phosphatase